MLKVIVDTELGKLAAGAVAVDRFSPLAGLNFLNVENSGVDLGIGNVFGAGSMTLATNGTTVVMSFTEGPDLGFSGNADAVT